MQFLQLPLLLLAASIQDTSSTPALEPPAAPVYVMVEPYGGVLNYSNSIKESGWLAGAYASALSGKNRIELGYEYTELEFFDFSKLRQSDLTAAYSRFLGFNYIARAGAHHTITTDPSTDGGTTLFGGLKYYEGLEFDTGLDVYYTRYPDFATSTSHSRGLGIWQLSPTISHAFGAYTSSWGSFYGTLGYMYIRPMDTEPARLESGYHSVSGTLNNYNGAWTTSLDVWGGRRAFAVRNGGFTVFNLAEEYRGGAELSLSHALGPAVSLKGLISYQRFREPQNDSDSSILVLGGFLVFSF